MSIDTISTRIYHHTNDMKYFIGLTVMEIKCSFVTDKMHSKDQKWRFMECTYSIGVEYTMLISGYMETMNK